MGDEERSDGAVFGGGDAHGGLFHHGAHEFRYAVAGQTQAEERRHGLFYLYVERAYHIESADMGTAARGDYHDVCFRFADILMVEEDAEFPFNSFISSIFFNFFMQYFLYPMPQMQSHAMPAHQMEQGVDYLHGVLRYREDTFVFLGEQFHALRLKPFIGISVAESLQQALHQPFAARIHLRQALHLTEGVGEVASSAAGYGYFGESLLAALVDVHLGVGQLPFDGYGGKASGCACSYYGYVHGAKGAG